MGVTPQPGRWGVIHYRRVVGEHGISTAPSHVLLPYSRFTLLKRMTRFKFFSCKDLLAACIIQSCLGGCCAGVNTVLTLEWGRAPQKWPKAVFPSPQHPRDLWCALVDQHPGSVPWAQGRFIYLKCGHPKHKFYSKQKQVNKRVKSIFWGFIVGQELSFIAPLKNGTISKGTLQCEGISSKLTQREMQIY